MEPQSPPAAPMTGCLTRLFWMFLGNTAAGFCLVFIARGPARSLSTYDWAYAAFIAGLSLARYIDIKCYAGETTAGTPATLAHWRRYTAGVVAIAAIAWLAVRAFLWLRHTGV